MSRTHHLGLLLLIQLTLGCSATATPPPKQPTLTGSWRLVEQRAVDGQPLRFTATYQEYTFRPDGTFDQRSVVENLDGASWSLSGKSLTLKRPPHGLTGEMAKYAPPPLLRTATVEELSTQRLVLVEPQPEAWGKPPRMVVDTFRRVREGDFGPMLGATVATAPVAAGTYAGAYQYSQKKYPTMEIYTSKGVEGRARLTLAADGAVTGCLAASSGRTYSRGKYAPGGEKKDRSEQRWLMGVAGSWKPAPDGGATVTLDKLQRGSCQVPAEPGSPSGTIEFACVGLRPSDRLPVASLACRLVKDQGLMRDMALNPADTVRAGPYNMQSNPMGHISSPQGRPWLLLGAAPGIHVRSVDGRDDLSPRVTFTARKVTLDERNYKPAKPR